MLLGKDDVDRLHKLLEEDLSVWMKMEMRNKVENRSRIEKE